MQKSTIIFITLTVLALYFFLGSPAYSASSTSLSAVITTSSGPVDATETLYESSAILNIYFFGTQYTTTIYYNAYQETALVFTEFFNTTYGIAFPPIQGTILSSSIVFSPYTGTVVLPVGAINDTLVTYEFVIVGFVSVVSLIQFTYGTPFTTIDTITVFTSGRATYIVYASSTYSTKMAPQYYYMPHIATMTTHVAFIVTTETGSLPPSNWTSFTGSTFYSVAVFAVTFTLPGFNSYGVLFPAGILIVSATTYSYFVATAYTTSSQSQLPKEFTSVTSRLIYVLYLVADYVFYILLIPIAVCFMKDSNRTNCLKWLLFWIVGIMVIKYGPYIAEFISNL